MIALSGIVVRNSLILVEYITQARNEGMPFQEALLQAGTARMRPVLLTAGTHVAGQSCHHVRPGFQRLDDCYNFRNSDIHCGYLVCRAGHLLFGLCDT